MDLAKRLIYLLVPTCFLFGLWWGLKEYRSQHRPNIQYSKSLNVLAPRGLIPASVKDAFERNFEIGLRIYEAESAKKLLYKVRDPATIFDVVFIYSNQISLKQTKDLFKENALDQNHIKKVLSPDFQWTPVDPNLDYILPLFWGVNGAYIKKSHAKKYNLDEESSWKEIYDSLSEDRKILVEDNAKVIIDFLMKSEQLKSEWLETEQADFARQPLRESLKRITLISSFLGSSTGETSQFKAPEKTEVIISDRKAVFMDPEKWTYILPSPKNEIWLLSVAVNKVTPLAKQAKSFIEFLTREKVAFSVAQKFYGSSTLIALNSSDLDQSKKSEFLREIPLTKIQPAEGLYSGLILWERLIDSLQIDSSKKE